MTRPMPAPQSAPRDRSLVGFDVDEDRVGCSRCSLAKKLADPLRSTRDI